jgi:hypothetical protein
MKRATLCWRQHQATNKYKVKEDKANANLGRGVYQL